MAAKTVVAAAGGTIGTDPAAIQGTQDVSLVVPPGACPVDLSMTISRILNPQVSSDFWEAMSSVPAAWISLSR